MKQLIKKLLKLPVAILKKVMAPLMVLWKCWVAAWNRRNVCVYLFARRYCKIKEKTVLWEAFGGRGILDNPKALFEAMLADPDFKDWKHIWALDDFKNHEETFKRFKGNKRIRFVTFESCKHFNFFATAKLVVSNGGLRRIFIKREGQIYIETWHGVPLKTLGRLANDLSLMSATYTIRSFLQADYLVSACPFLSKVYKNDFYLGDLFKGKILEAGYPRLDTIYHGNKDDVLANLAKEGVVIDSKKKILLYAPTWRGANYATPDTAIEPYLEVKRTLEKNLDLTQWQVLVKPHQIVYKTARKQFKDIDFMIPATIDANEVLSVTDLLVGDFSSIFYDFLLTRRPVVFYIPDLEEYKVSRGIYQSIESLPGPICQTLEELSETMLHLEERILPFAEAYNEQRERAGSHLDQGDISKRIMRHVLLGEPAPIIALQSKRLSYLFLLPPNLAKIELDRLIGLLNALDSEKVDVTLLTEGDKCGTLDLLKDHLSPQIRVLVRYGDFRTFMDELRLQRYKKLGAQIQKVLPKTYFKEECSRYLGQNTFDLVVDVSGASLFYTTMATMIPAKKHLVWAMGDLPSEARSICKGLSKVFPLYSRFDAVVTRTKHLQALNQKGLSSGLKVDLLEDYFDNALLVESLEKVKEDLPFDFSIIMAVYKVEPYLKEAIESVLKQDIGFEDHVQLILVDDGSPDGSGKICDEYAAKYPNNIIVIHKENGGVSLARNTGIDVATGRYLNFLDADDRLSLDALSKVKAFFDTHIGETDVVSVPIHFFEARTGEHHLNLKFKQGSRVIELNKDSLAVQMHIASSFIDRTALKKKRFNCNLAIAEDAFLLQEIFFDRPFLGVVHNARYWYRKRHDDSSAMGTRFSNIRYWKRLDACHLALVQLAQESCGRIPPFLRSMFAEDLAWCFRLENKIPRDIGLSEEEINAYKQNLRTLLQFVEDKHFVQWRHVNLEHKLAYLRMKYGQDPILMLKDKEPMVAFKDAALLHSFNGFQWHSLREEKDKIFICVAFTQFAGLPAPENVFVKSGSYEFQAMLLMSEDGTCFVDEPLYVRHLYEIEVPLRELPETAKLNFYFMQGGETYHITQISRHMYFPVSNQFNAAYCILQKRCIMVKGCTLILTRKYHHWKKELKLLLEIFKKRKGRWKEDLFIRVLRFVRQKLHCKPIWLLKDRAANADDNAEAMFRYLVKEHPEVKAYFIIGKTSPDGKRLAQTRKICPFASRKNRILSALSSVVLSSQVESWFLPEERKNHALRDIIALRPFVFLQHGVTKDFINWLGKYAQNLSGLVATATQEEQAFLKEAYGYSKREIWLTGFPRFDRLYHEEQKQITFMPTWRQWLFSSPNQVTGVWSPRPGFTESNYFKFYNALLSNKRLITVARELGYTLAFFPHPMIRLNGLVDKFNLSDVKVLSSEKPYREIYAKSDLVVTDYSSAVFDFAYLRKPVLYTHFDKDEMFSGKHTLGKGYFDYERDGFGEVAYTLEETVDCLIDYMKQGCQLKAKYRERIDKFFAFNDQNNCERVYQKVCELLEPSE